MLGIDELSLIDKNRPGIIHRLDKYTTGIIIVAKTDRAHYYLSEQFAQRKIKKVYRAIVWGKMNKEGNVEGNISRDRKKRTIFKLTNQEGRYSYSSYKLLSHSGLFSYIEVYPLEIIQPSFSTTHPTDGFLKVEPRLILAFSKANSIQLS